MGASGRRCRGSSCAPAVLNSSLRDVRDPAHFPAPFRDYIRFVAEETGIPVTMVSVGPNREQTIRL